MVSPPFLGWDGGFLLWEESVQGDGARRANRPPDGFGGAKPRQPRRSRGALRAPLTGGWSKL
ncbi:MAG: hypothetical protein EGQ05_06020 [Ruminococcaceae bacterium]|nr:hypothetical protein [Oscillospiraceae bacterium]MBD9108582.1 hypothetical protein [Oscillospiraceae bacterium]